MPLMHMRRFLLGQSRAWPDEVCFPSHEAVATFQSIPTQTHLQISLESSVHTTTCNLSRWLQIRQQRQSVKKSSSRCLVRATLKACTMLPPVTHLSAAFASKLAERIETEWDKSLITDLGAEIRGLPLPASCITGPRQGELDKLGTNLWNLSTRLRRDESSFNSKQNETIARKSRALCLLRAFAFLLLASASQPATHDRQRKSCVRLMKIALKAAKVCIEGSELSAATKVMERAADYQEALGQGESMAEEETTLVTGLRIEYFVVRMALVGTECSSCTSHR